MRFEELEVWKNAQALSLELGNIYYHKDFRNYSFADQIMRASISVSNNIAEGREKSSNKDFTRFLYIAKGSCGEVRSMNYLALGFGYITIEQEEIFRKKLVDMSVKLYNLIKSLG